MRSISESATYTLAFGGLPFLVGAGLAYVVGTSWPRVVGLLVLGSLAVAGVMFLLALAGSSECYECIDVLGARVGAAFLYFLLPAQVVGWIAGTVLGSTLRLLLGSLGRCPAGS